MRRKNEENYSLYLLFRGTITRLRRLHFGCWCKYKRLRWQRWIYGQGKTSWKGNIFTWVNVESESEREVEWMMVMGSNSGAPSPSAIRIERTSVQSVVLYAKKTIVWCFHCVCGATHAPAVPLVVYGRLLQVDEYSMQFCQWIFGWICDGQKTAESPVNIISILHERERRHRQHSTNGGEWPPESSIPLYTMLIHSFSLSPFGCVSMCLLMCS